MSKIKTGALVVAGAGILVASTSVAFGLIITGAAGYGLYTLYQKVFGPFRRYSGSSPFDSIQSDLDRLFERKREPRTVNKRAMDNDMDALVQGLPWVVRGLVKSMFSLVGSAMQSSMARAGELRRMTTEYVQAHVGDGDEITVATPQQWSETSVNGIGRVEAVFLVESERYSGAIGQVTAKASIGSNDELQLKALTYQDYRTGKVIDLLRDHRSGPRRTVIDAEYTERH